MTKKREKITEDEAKQELEKSMAHAEKIVDDADKIEELLGKINIKKIGEEFSKLTVMTEMARAYVKKEYTEIPKRSIVSIIGTIIYFVNPFDLIPDFVPGIGRIDDLSILLLCWKMVSKDIEDYLLWKKRE